MAGIAGVGFPFYSFGLWQVPLSRFMETPFLLFWFMAGSSFSVYGNLFSFDAWQT